MTDTKDEFHERKMEMWKRKQEFIDSLSEKELRAFIKGYMMGQRTVFKQLGSKHGCGGHGGPSQSCGCGRTDCNCGK